MAHPNFIERIRQRQEPAEVPTEIETLARRVPFEGVNPFDTAAVRWDQLVLDLETAKAEAEFHRGENVHLASEVDRLRQELAHRISFFDLEMERQTRRADRAVEELADLRGRLDLIGKAIIMVVEETKVKEPIKREEASSIAAPPPRNLSTIRVSGARPPIQNGDYVVEDFNHTPREGHPPSEQDAETARGLIDRLARVELMR